MDFYNIKSKALKSGVIEVYVQFKVCRSKDLMIRSKQFYAIWDESINLWSLDPYTVQRIIDDELYAYKEELEKTTDAKVIVKSMMDYSSKAWTEFIYYTGVLNDNFKTLDNKIVFKNTKLNKKSYATKALPYDLLKGKNDNYDLILNTLYDEKERQKIEWSIGSIIAGDAPKIQKFLVFYGEGGTGKSTVLNIIQELFEGYYTTFEAKALTSNNNAFATEAFKNNPLVALQHDGDLSTIDDNTKLNSIVSHEYMTMNEKYKASYMSRVLCFLYVATNKPVRITDAKSGMIRRLIDVKPSGRKLSEFIYNNAMNQIKFELPAIAYRCLSVYKKMGKDYYSGYRALDMIYKTDIFYNFVDSYYYILQNDEGISLTSAYASYKEYCDDSSILHKLPRYKFKDELKNYFNDFSDIARVNGKQVRSYYTGFKFDKFKNNDINNVKLVKDDPSLDTLVFDSDISLLDTEYAEQSAQYANKLGTPKRAWVKNKTKLKDIDTHKLHYVQFPKDHIIIDFDIKGDDGNKSAVLNLAAASKFPSTYGEFSKSGAGVHLHYLYTGDVESLDNLYSENVEIKVFKGNSSLRRKLTKCNTTPIASISSGLPLKEMKPVINKQLQMSSQSIREMIVKNLNKEIHASTASSVNFIYKVLDDAYNYKGGVNYDVSDLRNKVLVFASKSTHQADQCLKLVAKMKFMSKDYEHDLITSEINDDVGDNVGDWRSQIIIFDIEVYPNLLLICWMPLDGVPVAMINPTPIEVEEFMKHRLIGFNNRRYDNHILYARFLGYTNEQIYRLSQSIILNKTGFFREAYSISYGDVYEFSLVKQGLKKFEIELGISHIELDIPWDKPVPDKLIPKVVEYCCNDVIATKATFESRESDWNVRLLLSSLSGLSPNLGNPAHAAKIIFGNDKNPQSNFNVPDLSEEFPGYIFKNGKSTYMGDEVSEGGQIYVEEGVYYNSALLDIASQHPTSTLNMNYLGKYTDRYREIYNARLAIKHGDLETAAKLLDGKLIPYLKGNLKDLSTALKRVLNTVYGLSCTKYDNPFKDPRNIDNVIAKRGALFMVKLRHYVESKGWTVAHIKTDSIKIPGANAEIIKDVMDYGLKYGYTFEHEATYEKFCIVNKAVYIAKVDGKWTATGSQFKHPYVFKKMFSGEEVTLADLGEIKSVQTAIYIDKNESLNDAHNYMFVGKVGRFIPILSGHGGGDLYRSKKKELDDNEKNDPSNYAFVNGSKGHKWLEYEIVKQLKLEEFIDYSYYDSLIDAAEKVIGQYCDVKEFVK